MVEDSPPQLGIHQPRVVPWVFPWRAVAYTPGSFETQGTLDETWTRPRGPGKVCAKVLYTRRQLLGHAVCDVANTTSLEPLQLARQGTMPLCTALCTRRPFLGRALYYSWVLGSW